MNVLTFGKVSLTREGDELDGRLRPEQLTFLLSDLKNKLERILIGGKTKVRTIANKDQDNLKEAIYANLDSMEAQDVAAFVIRKLFDHLMDHLSALIGFHGRMIELNDGVMDAPGMFEGKNTADMCLAMEYILQCVEIVLAWNGCQAAENKSLLKEALFKVAKRRDSALNPKSSSTTELKSAALEYLGTLSESVIDISVAETLLRAIKTVGDDPDNDGNIHKMAKEFLSRDWRDSNGDKDKGARYNNRVARLLVLMLECSDERIKDIDDYTDKHFKKLLQSNKLKNAESEDIKTLSGATLYIHFKVS